VATAACSAAPASNGIVYGTAFLQGGPSAAQGHNPNKLYRMKDSTLTAARSDGKKFETTTSRAGTFSLSLPPGLYTLRTTCAVSTIRVTAGARVRHNVYCEAG
jgi:hypothetical protein